MNWAAVIVLVVAGELAWQLITQMPLSAQNPSDAVDPLSRDAQSFVDCTAAEEVLESLRDEAYACSKDEDCRLWPCNTSAIGTSPAADRYIATDSWLVEHCARSRLYAFGDPSEPACIDGRCRARVIQ